MKRYTLVLTFLILFTFLAGGSCEAPVWSLPEELTVIGEEAFAGIPGIGEIRLPDSVREIGRRAFAGSKLSLLALNGEIAQIDEDALEDADIEKLTAPMGTYAWQWAFDHGYITKPEPAPAEDFQWTVENETVRIGKYTGSDEWVIVPDEIDGYPVRVIGSRAFQQCAGIGTIEIPEGVERIEDRVFNGAADLESVILPDSVTYIGAYAFSNCPKLAYFRYPLELTEIGYENNGNFNIFRDCPSLKRISVPEGVTRIPNRMFRYAASLEQVILPSTLTEIGGNAFEYCTGIGILEMPEHLERVEDAAFSGMTSLKRIDLPDSVTYLGAWTFINCTSLEYFRYPLHLETVPNALNGSQSQFRGCTSLKRIDVPEGVTRIPERLFRNADCLEEVNLPSTLTTIGSNAFENCIMETLEMPEHLERVEDAAFSGMTHLKRIDLPDSVTYLGAWTFINCTSLEYFRYPLHLETVPNALNGSQSQFRGCTSLKRIDVPEGVTRIPERMFRNADCLEEVHLPSTLTTIGSNAFENCIMESLEIPEHLERVENAAFSGMTHLKRIDLPDSVTYLGAWAFVNCTNLEYFRYPLHLEKVPNDLNGNQSQFRGCTSLKRIDVPEGVTNIPDLMFRLADSLEEVSLPMSLRTVGDAAFEGAAAIREVYLNENVYSIAWNAFRNTTLTINCEWGTYALDYALEHSLPYFYLSRTGLYSLNGAIWPSGTLYRGDDFIFDGYVRSSVNVSNVTGTIYDAGGSAVRTANYDPEQTDHCLAGGFTNTMNIKSLGLGSYRFVLEGSAGEKYEVLVDSTFTIIPPPLRIRLLNPVLPDGLTYTGSGFTLGGMIESNYPIDSVTVTISSGSGEAARSTAAPGTLSYGISGLSLPFASLPSANYHLNVTAAANGETRLLAESAFTPCDLNGEVTQDARAAALAFVANAENGTLFTSAHTSIALSKFGIRDAVVMAIKSRTDRFIGTVISMLKSAGGGEGYDEYLVDLYEAELASIIANMNTSGIYLENADALHSDIMDMLLSGGEIVLSVTEQGILDRKMAGLPQQFRNNVFNSISSDFSNLSSEIETLKKAAGIAVLTVEMAESITNVACNYMLGQEVLAALAGTAEDCDNPEFIEAFHRLQMRYGSKTMNVISAAVNRAAKEMVGFGLDKLGQELSSLLSGTSTFSGAGTLYTLVNVAIDVGMKITGLEERASNNEDFITQNDAYIIGKEAYFEAYAAVKEGDHTDEAINKLLFSFAYAKAACLRVHETILRLRSLDVVVIDQAEMDSVQQYINRITNTEIVR